MEDSHGRQEREEKGKGLHKSQDADRRHTTRSLAEVAKATIWARFALSLGREMRR